MVVDEGGGHRRQRQRPDSPRAPENGPGRPVVANRAAALPWSLLHLSPLGDDYSPLRARSEGCEPPPYREVLPGQRGKPASPAWPWGAAPAVREGRYVRGRPPDRSE